MPSVMMATGTIGDHDVLAISVIRGSERLITLRDSIVGRPGIKNLQVSCGIERTETCPRYSVV